MYKLETFVDTKIVSLSIFVFSIKLIKSVVIIVYKGLLFLCDRLKHCIHKR